MLFLITSIVMPLTIWYQAPLELTGETYSHHIQSTDQVQSTVNPQSFAINYELKVDTNYIIGELSPGLEQLWTN